MKYPPGIKQSWVQGVSMSNRRMAASPLYHQRMQHLIILAHPSPHSFSHQLKDALVAHSLTRGWQPVVRDLYAMGFDPVLSGNDLAGFKSGQTPPDIATEQQLVAASGIITLLYPLWWAGFPAILKGYIDRVFAYGFAYKAGANGIEGLLGGKRVVIFTTMGNALEPYEAKNLVEAFRHTMGHEIFTFCGMTVADHRFFPQMTDTGGSDKTDLVEMALRSYE
ncbi:NAD(P)H-dependent oxidoreductase [Breznakibacter xylanolyticus]|uniref:NAD(P)H-dependent oxidoreductase n=1 Tax=Breznakibacter xylanolyticus TaxID=990 RepID=UPI001C8A3324|nr:NAD(P)H-dependent oxidoreductase [Breznakibacter xylanolyticus]